MRPFCCVQLLRRRSFCGCGCVLARAAAAVMVLVVDAVVFFDFGCLVVVLEADDLVVVGFAAVEFRFHEVFGEELGGVFLLPGV